MPAEPGAAPTRGAWLREVWRSSIGKKVIVAITGTVLAAYVVLHMYGNLKAFQGAGSGEPAIDRYSEWLRTFGEPLLPRSGMLWIIRVVLVTCLLIHVTGVVQLHARNRAARPAGAKAPVLQRSFASRTMLAGGLFLLGFVVFHILNLTTGTIDSGNFAQGAVYQNLYDAFQNPIFVIIYVAASLTLALHTLHGLWSSTQTAGWDKPNRNPTFRRISTAVSVAVAVGFASVPIAFWTGILGSPQ